ncbi:hypothetical protein [Chitinophaga pinensis]|uniref:Uncharacterized protein n=1 Tax=Chitinophaga pinensis TaxID=79329 RepID=A0A5C6LJQ2_9BACT|nr:hypothetical protein [Chitinophaga pinensis]TWV90757.1 hypothetical protein FEF09_29280 [Chitinophaga pinensis]
MVVGTNFGLTLFNGMSASIGVATPLNVKNSKHNQFLNFSLDIPIVEYLNELTNSSIEDNN